MIISVLSVLITFSIVVFVHELGHFIVAVRSGVLVHAFSIGFGPEIIGFTHKGIRYKFSLIPLGGYVKMKGEDPEEEGARESDAFMGLEPFKRMAVIAAGPFMNFVTGMLIFSGIIYFSGMPQLINKPVVGGFTMESPAEKAGLKIGDKIISINDKEIKSWYEIAEHAGVNAGNMIELVIEREGERMNISLMPEMNKEVGRVLIGITQPYEIIRYGLFKSFAEGARYTVLLCVRLVEALWLMATGKMAAAIAGPIGIAKVVSRAANDGLVQLLQWIALISINLGFINLFPIPILDGGHIVFAICEKIKGSPIDPQKVNIANMVGLTLILALIIFATWQDIARIVFK
ncbi:MAG: RIP metalloprotease RseP [Elusimicrobiota bacterium]